MAVKMKQPNEFIDNLKEVSSIVDNSFISLGPADRAIIYAMSWCNTPKSNKDKYPFKNLMDVAKEIKEFIS